jgi:hypothetical protein
MASAPVAGDVVALGAQQRQRPTVVEDWVPHGPNVGAERESSGRGGPDWHGAVADRDEAVTYVPVKRVKLVV